MTATTLAGIIRDLPDAEYRAAPGYGSTAFKWFSEEVPAQAKYWIDNRDATPTVDASHIGHLLHALVLGQPNPFIQKDWNLSTKVGKARAAEVLAEHGGPEDSTDLDATGFEAAFAQVGVTVMGATDYELAKGCAEGVLRHPTTRAMLERPGAGEVSVFADIEGVACKARFDWLPELSDRRLVALDLKTALSANPRKFTKSVANYEYAIQHALYLDVLDHAVGGFREQPEMLFVAIDRRPPHLVALIGLPEMWKQIGRDKVTRARGIIRECEETGIWPDFGTEIHYVEPPSYYIWAAAEQENDAEIQV